MLSPRSMFVAGMRAFVPVIIGVVPFALVSGVAAVNAGLSLWAAIGMSIIVYAGSAQLVAVQLIGAQAPGLLIIATTAIVNLRFLMYSASIASHLQQVSHKLKWASGYLLTDQSYAIAISYFHSFPRAQHKVWYYLGAGLTMWATWQVGTLLGMFLGAYVPASWQLDFVIPLTFITLVVPAIKNTAFGAAAATAGIVAILTATFPFKLGLVISALLGVAVGLWVETRTR